MKVFRGYVPSDDLSTMLAARLVAIDIALMRAADPSRRAPFRQSLRASIDRLRKELARSRRGAGAGLPSRVADEVSAEHGSGQEPECR